MWAAWINPPVLQLTGWVSTGKFLDLGLSFFIYKMDGVIALT